MKTVKIPDNVKYPIPSTRGYAHELCRTKFSSIAMTAMCRKQ
jgi:hypothetical protein